MLYETSKELIAQFKASKQDGWTITEIIVFIGECLTTLVKTATTLASLSGDERADWVCEEIKNIYWAIDPDIPKIPNWIETPIEKALINFIMPGCVKLAYNSVFKKN